MVPLFASAFDDLCSYIWFNKSLVLGIPNSYLRLWLNLLFSFLLFTSLLSLWIIILIRLLEIFFGRKVLIIKTCTSLPPAIRLLLQSWRITLVFKTFSLPLVVLLFNNRRIMNYLFNKDEIWYVELLILNMIWFALESYSPQGKCVCVCVLASFPICHE